MYGVLKSTVNTGDTSELQLVFTAPMSVISNQPAFISDTLSLKRKASSQNAQRWEISAGIAPTNDTSAMLVHSVKNGYTKVIYIRMPQPFGVSLVPASRNLTLNGAHLATSAFVSIAGLSGSQMVEGEFIAFTGDSKVYLVVGAGVNGIGVEIYPPLRRDLANNAVITHGDEVTLAARYDSDTQLGMKYTDGVLVNPGTLKFVEAL